MELWDLYTKDRKLTGETQIRGEKIPDDRYHLVVHIWIKNNKNQFLISKRADNLSRFPSMWECPSGSALKGENSLQAAIREAKEEVGIDLSHKKGTLVFSKVRKGDNIRSFNDILDVWLFEYDGEINLNNATTQEVSEALWLNLEEIQNLDNENKFIKSHSYCFQNPFKDAALKIQEDSWT